MTKTLGGNAMRSLFAFSLALLGSVTLAPTLTDAATITGTVKGPDGAAFRAAFVQARNAKTKITVHVLSDNQGHYKVENLPAGDYRVAIRAPGYKADPKSGLALTADQNATQDFALQRASYVGPTCPITRGRSCCRISAAKILYFQHCIACH